MWVKKGIIPAIRVGRFIRIDESEALAALRAYSLKSIASAEEKEASAAIAA
jgi:hypothetical protein